MTCREVEITVSAFLDGETTASEWHEAEKHIAGCARCAALLQEFETGTRYFRHELPRAEAPEEVWPAIAARLRPQAASGSAARWLNRLAASWRRLRVRPGFAYAAAGTATMIILAAGLFAYFNQFIGPEVPAAHVPARASVARTGAAALQHERRAIRTADIKRETRRYLERAEYLLMEITGSARPPAPEVMDYIRQTSSNLLEQTVIVKKDLQKAQLEVLRGVIDDLEMVLLETASLSDTTQPAEYQRLRALYYLQEVKAPEAYPVLAEILESEKDRDLRLRALYALEDFDDARIVPILLKMMQTEKDRDLRLRALYALENFDDPRSVPVLLKIAGDADESPDVRLRALYALEDIDDPRSIPILIKIAGNARESKDLRLRALYALEEIGTNAILDPLMHTVRNDAAAKVRLRAVSLLEDLENARALPALIAVAKDDPNYRVRERAIRALRSFDDPRAAAALREILEKQD